MRVREGIDCPVQFSSVQFNSVLLCYTASKLKYHWVALVLMLLIVMMVMLVMIMMMKMVRELELVLESKARHLLYLSSSNHPYLHVSTSPHLYFLCQMHVGNLPISHTKNTQ